MRPHFALIDGRDLPDGLICPARPIIDGDALSMSIAAASIVAKTMRDALMRNLDRDYPHYGFAEHVGYATAGHRRALALFGPLPLSPALVPARAGRRLTAARKRFQKG